MRVFLPLGFDWPGVAHRGVAAAGLTLLLGIAGCAVPSRGRVPAAPDAEPSAVTASTPLLDVYVPGAVRNMYDAPGKKLNPLLNPRTAPPRFDEKPADASACSAHSLADLGEFAGKPLVDRSSFEAVMRRGLEVAQARHVWKFNKDRADAQWAIVGGERATRSAQAGRTRRSDSGAAAKGGPAGRGGLYSADQINAMTTDFGKLQAQLRHNFQVLAAQDEALTEAEQKYADDLVGMYSNAAEGLAQVPRRALPLGQFKAFELFRLQQVRYCVEARGRLTPQTSERLAATDARYREGAKELVAIHAADLIQSIRAATSSTEIRDAFLDRFGSQEMLDLALGEPAVAAVYRQRSQIVLAEEQRAREAQEREDAATWAGTVPKHVPVTVARPHKWTPLDPYGWKPALGQYASDEKRGRRTFDDAFDRIWRIQAIGEGRTEAMEASCVGNGISGVRLMYIGGSSAGVGDDYGSAVTIGYVKYGVIPEGEHKVQSAWFYADLFQNSKGMPEAYLIRPEQKDQLMAQWSLAGDLLKSLEGMRASLSGDPAHYRPVMDVRDVIRAEGVLMVLTPRNGPPVEFRFAGKVARAFANMCSGRGGPLDVREAAIQEEQAWLPEFMKQGGAARTGGRARSGEAANASRGK